MPYNIIVLAKQVPDTTKVSGKMMKEDGTINRPALPTIFNPDDLHGLEMALSIKDQHGGKVTVITMGPATASMILRESLYRGADEAILVSESRCAASDTLATSYILSCAIQEIPDYDIIICGRQAIDGDTAQVGPQVAQKLDIPQVTYVDDFLSLKKDIARVKKVTEIFEEIIEVKLPVLLTVLNTANEVRPPMIQRVAKHKKARTLAEHEKMIKEQNPDITKDEISKLAAEKEKILRDKGIFINHWTLDNTCADVDRCGISGSPTRVYKIDNVVLTAGESKKVEPTDEAIDGLIHELIENHTIG